MLPTRRRITDEDLQLILEHDLDDEFMDDIMILWMILAVLDTFFNVGVSDSIILVNI